MRVRLSKMDTGNEIQLCWECDTAVHGQGRFKCFAGVQEKVSPAKPVLQLQNKQIRHSLSHQEWWTAIKLDSNYRGYKINPSSSPICKIRLLVIARPLRAAISANSLQLHFMVTGFIHLLDNIYHAALLKNHPLKFKSRQKLPSSSKILAWIQPCICLHFTPLGLLGKTVGDWKPWSDQNCLGHTKGSSFVHHPKQAPNRFPPLTFSLFHIWDSAKGSRSMALPALL